MESGKTVQFSFFFQPTDKNKSFNKEEIINIYNKRKKWDFSNIEEIYKYDNFENETHSDVLTRILFTYSFIIKDVSYHQGMNELLAPIYYTFSYDKLYLEENMGIVSSVISTIHIVCAYYFIAL